MSHASALTNNVFRTAPLASKGLAILLSVSAHAAVAFAFASAATRGTARANPARDELVPVAMLELALPPAPAVTAQPATVSVLRPHTHPYPVPPDHDRTPHDPSLNHLLSPAIAGDPPLAPTQAAVDAPAAVPIPRFTMTVSGSSAHPPSSDTAFAAEPSGPAALALPAPEALVDTPARLISGMSVRYTAEAQAAGVEAEVPLEIVVDEQGAVQGARVLTHVGYGLDEAALHGVRAFRFAPALRAGKPRSVRMRWVVSFQLR